MFCNKQIKCESHFIGHPLSIPTTKPPFFFIKKPNNLCFFSYLKVFSNFLYYNFSLKNRINEFDVHNYIEKNAMSLKSTL